MDNAGGVYRAAGQLRSLERESKVSDAVRANCFDASALLKLYVQEDGSETVRAYWRHEPTKFTTTLSGQKDSTIKSGSTFR